MQQSTVNQSIITYHQICDEISKRLLSDTTNFLLLRLKAFAHYPFQTETKQQSKKDTMHWNLLVPSSVQSCRWRTAGCWRGAATESRVYSSSSTPWSACVPSAPSDWRRTASVITIYGRIVDFFNNTNWLFQQPTDTSCTFLPCMNPFYCESWKIIIL